MGSNPYLMANFLINGIMAKASGNTRAKYPTNGGVMKEFQIVNISQW